MNRPLSSVKQLLTTTPSGCDPCGQMAGAVHDAPGERRLSFIDGRLLFSRGRQLLPRFAEDGRRPLDSCRVNSVLNEKSPRIGCPSVRFRDQLAVHSAQRGEVALDAFDLLGAGGNQAVDHASRVETDGKHSQAGPVVEREALDPAAPVFPEVGDARVSAPAGRRNRSTPIRTRLNLGELCGLKVSGHQ